MNFFGFISENIKNSLPWLVRLRALSVLVLIAIVTGGLGPLVLTA